MLEELVSDTAICNTCLKTEDVNKLVEVRNCFGFPMLQCLECFNKDRRCI